MSSTSFSVSARMALMVVRVVIWSGFIRSSITAGLPLSTARWKAGEIRPDPTEIADAQFFDLDALPELPGSFSIAGRVIAAVVEQLRDTRTDSFTTMARLIADAPWSWCDCAIARGGADEIVPLPEIAERVLALVRSGAVSETLAKGAIHSERMVPGSWISVLPVAATDCRKVVWIRPVAGSTSFRRAST